jgi:mono/diheme cytochrome c family protein
MRERWARWLALLTTLMVLLLAAGFAWLQNPAATAPASESTPTEPAPLAQDAPSLIASSDAIRIGRGQLLFENHGCMRCHSVDGHGSPRSPLDGVGARHDDEAMRHWILGDEVLGKQITTRTRNAKQAYRELPQDELDAMVAWLRTLQ